MLGINGGIAGIYGALFALLVGKVDSAFSITGTSSIVGLGIAAIIFSLLGLVGGAFTVSRPKIAGIMMLFGAFGGLISISWGYVVAFPVLLLGGIFALLSQKTKPLNEIG